jgi:hypothetical protein
VLNWGSPLLAIGPIDKKIASAQNLLDKSVIRFTQSVDGVILSVPPQGKDEVDRVIVLTVAK